MRQKKVDSLDDLLEKEEDFLEDYDDIKSENEFGESVTEEKEDNKNSDFSQDSTEYTVLGSDLSGKNTNSQETNGTNLEKEPTIDIDPETAVSNKSIELESEKILEHEKLGETHSGKEYTSDFIETTEFDESKILEDETSDDKDFEKNLFEDLEPKVGGDFGASVTSSGRDVYTQSSLINYYDAIISGEDVGVGAFDNAEALFGEFVDNHNDEIADRVSQVLGAWTNWPTNKSTAPLWHIFAEANDNFRVPIEVNEQDLDAEAFAEALQSFEEFTQQKLRERFGESLVLYRSIDQSGFEKMKDEAAETGSIVLDHRPVESWTIDPEFAKSWSGEVVLRKEVDVEDVVASQVTHPSFYGSEKEFLVESSGKEKYSEDEMLMPGEFDMEENAEWALSQLGNLENNTERIYGSDWMAIENRVSQISLIEYGAITANKSSEFMHVAEYEDGRQAFITELSDTEYQNDNTGADPVEAERAIAGEQFFKNIGLEKYIPEHFVDLDEGYMAVEAVDGYEINKAPEEVKENVDSEEYLKFAAASILSGNSDMDGRNTMIDEKGHIHGIDIDHAGGDFTDGGRHYRRGMEDLKSNADKLGLDISYSDIKEATEFVAGEIDPFEATEGIQSSQISGKDMYNFRRNIANNITSFAEGEFPGEFGIANNQNSSYGAEEAIRI